MLAVDHREALERLSNRLFDVLVIGGSIAGAGVALGSPVRRTNPGRWWSEQVGVKAPGTPKRTTFPWPRTSADVVASGPLSPKVNTFTSGTVSPTAIAIRCLLP